jgi:hypothetical protein
MRRFVLSVIILVVVGLSVMIVIDANKISGLKLDKISEVEYRATLKNSSSKYIVKYVPKENIYPYFGKAYPEFGNGTALVRSDLPKNVQDFVLRHEIYHLQDKTHKNIISREIHANLAPIPYSPMGFVETVFMTLTDKDRVNYYLKLIF